MGEVIKMFGDGESGPFGTGYNAQGLGQSAEPDYQDPKPPGDAPQAGAPAAPVTVSQDIQAGVALALEYARTATNRLVNIPPPGAIETKRRKDLLEAYATIEDAAQQILDAAQNGGAGIDLAQETTRLQEDAQAYVQAVEETIADHTSAGAAPSMSSRGGRNWLLWGALAAGVGVAGYAAYRAQQARG